ncbi:STAS domain-containing protein [Streptomyces sp. ISL-11]|uniref:STAS domain-containing protein n=1 Tax=Streptomyces sp. ISL-11 TaxID=2819174 RepID=UPI001BEC137C|nr:STAS domain-containing protein [Streptomyces sp. ISL-11]MBT2383720.1 STAS domain-containing protein [Streptomyces sp. ISL-11]
MGADEPAFALRERVACGAIIIELLGEIDILADQLLGPRVDTLTERFRADIVIDLRRVTFLDASGLRLLLRARHRVNSRGGRLRLVRGVPRVSRVMRIAGVESGFTVVDVFPAVRADAGGAEPRDGSVPA